MLAACELQHPATHGGPAATPAASMTHPAACSAEPTRSAAMSAAAKIKAVPHPNRMMQPTSVDWLALQ